MPAVIHQPWTAAMTGLLHGCPSLRHGLRASAGQSSDPSTRRGPDFGEIESGGEVVAVRVQDACAQVVVTFQAFVRAAEILQHFDVEGVSLCGPVEPNVKDVAPLFDYDTWHSAESKL